MHASISAARGAVRKLLDFALPPRCAGCGAVTGDAHGFCIGCWQSLTFLGDPCCARCGLPFEYDAGEGVECGACLTDPPSFERLRAAVAYGAIASKVALKLKYGGKPGVAETLGRFMQRHVEEHVEGQANAILAPVPLHRWRIWRRGYNQSALIAKALGRRTGLPVELDLIRRVKATPPLKGLGRRERAQAVRGAFRMSERGEILARGRTILLIDDVYTTGATADACARTLKRAGAAAVNIICWARVVPVKGD